MILSVKSQTVYNMRTSGSEVRTTCLETFRSSSYTGATTNGYANGESGTVTYTSSDPTKKINVTFSVFYTEGTASYPYDNLKVYDGTSTSGTLLGTMYGNLTGTFLPTFSSSTVGGSLTFVFTSDGSSRYTGWTANVFCGDYTPPVTQVAADYCADATFICNLNGYSGNTSSSYTIDQPSNIYAAFGAGSIDNNSWIEFVANNDTVSLDITVSNCSNGDGVQFGILSGTNCTNFTRVSPLTYASSGIAPGTQNFFTTGLIPGQQYYIMIDGFSGDVCDYVIVAGAGVAAPLITSTSSTVTCGTPVTLTVGGVSNVTGVTWSSSPTDPNINTGNLHTNPLVTSPSVTTTYTAVVLQGNTECPDAVNVTKILTVNAVTAELGAKQTICSGATVNLNAVGTGTTWAWYPNTSNTTQTASVTPSVSTTYTVTATTVAGCSATDNVAIDVNPLPVTNAGIDTAFCKGSSVVLGASGGGTYTWSPTSGLSSSTSATPTANPAATTTYTVVAKNTTTLCTAADQIIVKVRELPVAFAGDDNTICKNSSLNLNATGGTTYLWTSPTTGLSATNINNPIATPTATITYIVSVTDAYNCSKTDNIKVTVNPVPTAEAGNPLTVCSGYSANVGSASVAGVTYQWSSTSSPNVSNPNISATTANPTITSTYTVTASLSTGCLATDNVVVTVNPLPVAEANINQTINYGTSTTLAGSATGGTTPYASYSWSPTSSLVNANVQNPTTTNLTVTTVYTLTVTDAKGCTSTDQMTVVVQGSPLTVVATVNDNVICKGETVQLTGTPAGGSGSYPTWTWSSTPAGFSSNIQNPTATPTITTTYKVTVNDGYNTATSSVIVTVNNLPTAEAGANVSVCSGSCATLTATGAGTGSYTWSPNATLATPYVASTSACPTNTTLYLVSITDANGCTATDNVTVTVNPLPTVDAGLDVTIFNGTSTTLNGTASGGTGPYTYHWSPPTFLNDHNLQSPTATNVTVTTIYTLSVTDNSTGCSYTDQVTVFVKGGPLSFDLTPNSAIICAGDCAQLNATPSGGSGVYSYAWSANTYTFSYSSSDPLVCPAASTTYTVTVNDGSNTVVGNAVVTVNPLPAANAGSDVTICNGDTTILSATGGVSYLWTPNLFLSSDVIATPDAYPNATRTYTVSVTDNKGCSKTDNVIVTVNSLPVAEAGNDATICKNLSTMLTASGGDSYSWSPSTGLSATNIAGPNANPTSSITYTVTVSYANTCSSTDKVVIHVDDLPTVEAGSNVSICKGSSTTLNGSGTGNFEWTPNTALTSNSIADPIASPTSSIAYQLKVTDANGCTAVDNVSINVWNLPTVNAGSDLTICKKDTVQVTATGGVSYVWSPNIAISNINIPNPNVYPAITRTYYVTATDGNGCSAADDIILTVNSLPLANAGNDKTICLNSPTALLATGGVDYDWTPSSGLDHDNIANVNASPNNTTTYIVNVTGSNGCELKDTVVVFVNPLPIANAGVDISICLNSSDTLNGTGGVSCTWSPSTGLNSNVSYTPIANPTVTVFYNLLVSDANGCTASDQVAVNVLSLPTILACNDIAVCKGDTAQLSASGAVSYDWHPALNLNDSSIYNPQAFPQTTSTYIVKGKDANGCENTDNVVVSIYDLPIISAGTDNEVCLHSNVNLSASGANTYVWSPTSGLINVNTSSPTASPANTTLYTVTGTDNNGCKNKDDVLITVLPLPNANAGVDKTICKGSSTEIYADGGISYFWDPSTGLSSAIISNPAANPNVNTTYYLSVKDAKNCSDKDTLVITVLDLPVTNAGADQTICRGDTAHLSANAVGAIGYFWMPNYFNGQSQSVMPNATTTYVVKATDANTCTNTDDVTVNVTDLPIVTLESDIINNQIVTGQLVTFTALPNTYANYDFYVNDSLKQSSSSNIFQYNLLKNGDIVKVVALYNGCNNETGIDNMKKINVIPIVNAFTPNGDNKNDVFVKGIDLQVFNRWGQLMYEGKEGWDGYYKGNLCEAGTYYYVLTFYDLNNVASTIKGSLMLIKED